MACQRQLLLRRLQRRLPPLLPSPLLQVKSALMAALEALPAGALLGIITFGSSVSGQGPAPAPSLHRHCTASAPPQHCSRTSRPPHHPPGRRTLPSEPTPPPAACPPPRRYRCTTSRGARPACGGCLSLRTCRHTRRWPTWCRWAR
jgi:hypothetical protein